ncbi:hypothetical protein LEP1GSC175_3659 [Leptospira santarosai str. HAI821]|nr:hypothetical protein LEP1GSC175_3659 [Leptospira santarosai str. HAI821]
MNRFTGSNLIAQLTFPHMRGVEPPKPDAIKAEEDFSPHAWG